MAKALLHTARLALESASQLGGRHALCTSWAMAQRRDDLAHDVRPFCASAGAETQVSIDTV
jgi:hypothetical protein